MAGYPSPLFYGLAERRRIHQTAIGVECIQSTFESQGAEVTVKNFTVIADGTNDVDHEIIVETEICTRKDILTLPEETCNFRVVAGKEIIDILAGDSKFFGLN
jgi:hypothetical protein